MTPSYNFDDPLFKKEKRYKRWAKEHKILSELKSDRIKWRVLETITHLKIPIKYEIDFHVKSIIGINEDLSPIYGNKHTIEVELPAKFPLETFKARATTDIWHPNIKWDGPTKGRICVNNKSFGKSYDIYWFTLRMGEIIQYKNYLADNIPPYPEDAKVAKWVLNYAQPNGIVSRKDKIAIDNSNLKEYTEEKPKPKKLVIKIKKIEKPKPKIRIVNNSNKSNKNNQDK